VRLAALVAGTCCVVLQEPEAATVARSDHLFAVGQQHVETDRAIRCKLMAPVQPCAMPSRVVPANRPCARATTVTAGSETGARCRFARGSRCGAAARSRRAAGFQAIEGGERTVVCEREASVTERVGVVHAERTHGGAAHMRPAPRGSGSAHPLRKLFAVIRGPGLAFDHRAPIRVLGTPQPCACCTPSASPALWRMRLFCEQARLHPTRVGSLASRAYSRTCGVDSTQSSLYLIVARAFRKAARSGCDKYPKLFTVRGLPASRRPAGEGVEAHGAAAW
jgi:hypothetical protein